MKPLKLSFVVVALLLFSCSSDDNNNPPTESPQLIIKLKFNPNQARLNNLGQPSTIPSSNAAQSPTVRQMSANYIEFAPSATTLLGEGEIIFSGDETTAGGGNAINFQNAMFAGNNETFLTIPLSEVANGNYEWVRVSLAYQEGDINFKATDGNSYTGTLASFVGYNTYITSFDLNGSAIEVNANRLQGFWAFEALGFTAQGQAPAGATTVPNPLFNSSPIPQGSCVVTGQFENGLTITGNETQDVVVTLSFSINDSFEWTEVNFDGQYEPGAGEQVVDMGLRGLIPLVGN
ncbi:hypothetical protein M0G43_02200 [Subsaxibacter sp. CAU 1640]|uniref:hypothetical protein n=1 Tax=Subsaxibacter sp. CAU 1640 TaxID=2933271 RepID=UPI002004DA0F|nr:hypothetical protein [Subsaxibacter sp. CAU 1640]MCK7589377.1 hypothetical protein [Subsaxibacter sp. CAU 1640]